jgi:hypothetical protein
MLGFLDELRQLQPLKQAYDKLRNQLATAKRRLETIQESLRHSPVQVLRDEITEIEQVKYIYVGSIIY